MPLRLLAILVALVLLLSLSATHMHGMSLTPACLWHTAELAQRGLDGTASAVLADDEQTSGQDDDDGANDLLALLMTRPEAEPRALTMDWPQPYVLANVTWPYLEGPHRPPRATVLVA